MLDLAAPLRALDRRLCRGGGRRADPGGRRRRRRGPSAPPR
ncbi:MAG: hypothetical protein WDM92_10420 [Caulobacteraceae bacterium]